MNRFYDVEPNSEQHQQLRLGVVTASQVSRIMTLKKRALSSQAPNYMFHKIAERATGEPSEIEAYQAPWMERGIALEDQAVKCYEGLHQAETSRGGFWMTLDGNVGCSPDRLVGKKGLLEIKCPLMPRQIETALVGVGDDYIAQIQFQLFVTEREWVDIFSYHPRLILDPIRVYRDNEFIADLEKILQVFVDEMLRRCAELEAQYGPFPLPGLIAPPPVAKDDPLGVAPEELDAIFAARRQKEQQG